MKTFVFVWFYVDPWDASFDEERENEFVAPTKEDAVAQFRAEYGDACVLCVYEKDK